MRSRPEMRPVPLAARRIAAMPMAAVPIVAVLIAFTVMVPAPRAQSAQPTEGEIGQAIETVKKDPNLATEMTVSSLRWIGKQDKPTKKPNWGFLSWLGDLMRWFDRSARLLMYVAIAILAGWLAVYIVRLVQRRGPRRAAADEFVAPTHVRDLDIRPEALPPDIGAAARALWDRGEQRAALVLLYRGLLSRLAHVHRVPIRDSSTEGDCLALASNHLKEASRRDYASRLIQVWRRAVYARQEPTPAAVYDLCDAFSSSLDLASAIAAGSPAPKPGGAA